jgi:hypothetical protein
VKFIHINQKSIFLNGDDNFDYLTPFEGIFATAALYVVVTSAIFPYINRVCMTFTLLMVPFTFLRKCLLDKCDIFVFSSF